MAEGDARSLGREQGVALLLAIWVLTLLAAIAAGLTSEVRAGLDLTRNVVEASRARALADSGVWGTVAALLESEGAGLRLDGAVQSLAVTAPGVTVAVVDERGKLDLNHATEETLRRLLRAAGVVPEAAAALARRIADYRIRHEERQCGMRPRGTGPGACRPAPAFEGVKDVQALGVTAEDYGRIAPFLTTYSGDWRINPLTAPREVLMALPGVSATAAARYLAQRQGADPFALRTGTPPAIGAYAAWGPPRAVTVRATAVLDSGATYVREAVVEITPEAARPYRLREWLMRERPS